MLRLLLVSSLEPSEGNTKLVMTHKISFNVKTFLSVVTIEFILLINVIMNTRASYLKTRVFVVIIIIIFKSF